MRHRLLLFALILTIVPTVALAAAATGVLRVAAPSACGGPCPLDPLTPTEIKQATTRATSDATLAGARSAVLYVELHEEAKTAAGAWPRGVRRAHVVAYNYATDQLVDLIVNLNTDTVDLANARTGIQPYLSADELARAHALALADPTVQAALQTAGLKPDPTLTFAEIVQDTRGACATHRCAYLTFNTPDAEILGVHPVIDLSAERVERQSP